MKRTTTRVAVLATAVTAVMATGIAFAAWTTNGAGTGSAKSADKLDVSYGATTVTAQLYPTGKGDVKLSVTNNNGYKVQLNQFHVSGIYYSTDTNHATDVSTTCDLTFSGPASGAGPVVGNGTTVVTLAGALAMGNGADNACANKTFDVAIDTSVATSSGAALNATWTAP